MFTVVAVGCGMVLGLAAAELVAPHYLRLLGTWPLRAGRLGRAVLRAHRLLLARAGHHPYLLDCLEALAQASDGAALTTARARLQWWCALRLAARS